MRGTLECKTSLLPVRLARLVDITVITHIIGQSTDFPREKLYQGLLCNHFTIVYNLLLHVPITTEAPDDNLSV